MAHAVENMFSVRETPWHNLGKVLGDAPTLADGLIQAGLDWDVILKPVEYDGIAIPHLGNVVVRQSDNKPLGVVGPQWTPLQNSQAFDWFAPFLESGLCKLETAGSLHGGKVVWVMSRITTGDMKIDDGDEVRKYLLLSNSHDGSQSVRVGFSPIRVVCANTLGMAHRDSASKLLRIRHTQGLHYTLNMVRETINAADQAFNATAEQFRKLSRLGINQLDLKRYVVQVIAANPNDTTAQEETKIKEIIDMAIHGRGNEGRKLSLWTAYNGITEYLNYNSGRTADTRLDSLWFGKANNLSQYALDVAIQLSA